MSWSVPPDRDRAVRMSEPEVADQAASHADGRWWTVDPLILLPHQGRVRLMSPRADRRVVVTSEIAQFLLLAQTGYPADPPEPPFDWSPRRYLAVTRTLASYGYLVGDPDSASAKPDTPWRYWGPLAWAYHQEVTSPPRAGMGASGGRREESRPSSFRPSTDEILLLPRLSPRTDKGFIEVLEQRRTHRDFLPEPVALDAFSDILRYSFGPLRFVDGGPLGVLQLRAAASGGARHETEAYVYVFDVDSVRPGLYAYDGLRHGLVPVRSGDLRDEVERLTVDQGFFRRAAFGVVTVAMSDRMSWKYQNPGAYRVLWQNVGHLAQVFSLMCASVDLGASLTGAIRVGEARACLGLRAPSEIVTLAMACGRPELADDGLPTSIRTPDVPFRP